MRFVQWLLKPRRWLRHLLALAITPTLVIYVCKAQILGDPESWAALTPLIALVASAIAIPLTFPLMLTALLRRWHNPLWYLGGGIFIGFTAGFVIDVLMHRGFGTSLEAADFEFIGLLTGLGLVGGVLYFVIAEWTGKFPRWIRHIRIRRHHVQAAFRFGARYALGCVLLVQCILLAAITRESSALSVAQTFAAATGGVALAAAFLVVQTRPRRRRLALGGFSVALSAATVWISLVPLQAEDQWPTEWPFMAAGAEASKPYPGWYRGAPVNDVARKTRMIIARNLYINAMAAKPTLSKESISTSTLIGIQGDIRREFDIWIASDDGIETLGDLTRVIDEVLSEQKMIEAVGDKAFSVSE